MLQEILKDLQSSLKSYNQGLAKQNMLVEIPWTIVDGDLNIQRLIFRKNNTLMIVKEGEIQESKWEYLPSMNSLIIEIGGKKILLNEVFADGKALILKKDGMSQEFLAFANENELPNLNLVNYFKHKAYLESDDFLKEKLEKERKYDLLYLIIYTLVLIAIIVLGVLLSS